MSEGGSVMKITLADLNENFGELLEKARAGKCCLRGCDQPAALVVHDRSCPPYLCREHRSDGSLTHYGSWVPTGRAYYDMWNCCETTWKLCGCNRLEAKFREAGGIPISAEQIREADAESARLLAQQEENERWERMINAGREEAYDR